MSSSYVDLREHRAAAIRVLRQLGHEVLAMEDMVAGSAPPLTKVLDMVDRAEAYVGIFAWRYGSLPALPLPATVKVRGAKPGETSITHFEYLRAKQREITILAFLLEENEPWSPAFVDGFALDTKGTLAGVERIRALRLELQQEKVVSWFTTPASLEARVAAAVTMAGLSSQIDVQPAVAVPSGGPGTVDSSAGMIIAKAVGKADASQRVFKIDLAQTWWSTRLYLIAALAERLTQVRRVLVVRSPPPGDPATAGPSDHVAFVGQLSTATIIATLKPMHPQLAKFERWLLTQPAPMDDTETAAMECMRAGWAPAFGGARATSPDALAAEQRVKIDLTPDLLIRWFGDSMLQQPVEIFDLKRASVVDLMRLVDYPSPFVPVLSGRAAGAPEALGEVEVLDKTALNARLAHSYLTELKERDRIE